MKVVNDKVTVRLTGIDGKEVVIEKPVSYNEIETTDDVLTLSQKDETFNELKSAANYGFNLKARAKVTAQIKQENQGPEVSVNRLLAQMEKNYKKAGKTFDEKKQRDFIMANLEQFGIVA